ncbi:MAG: hypothetical protein NVSMB31_01210 [Vulcanimicrobiaceae bacterium]
MPASLILANPATYIAPSDFMAQRHPDDIQAQLLDMGAAQVTDLLVRASGAADGLMRRSLLAREVTELFDGTGSREMELERRPVIYVREISYAQPGLANIVIPSSNLLIDYERGVLTTYTSVILPDGGLYARFPRNARIRVSFAYGYGFTIAQPVFTLADSVFPLAGTRLNPGSYDIGVTARTPWGETTSIVRSFASVTGQIAVTIQPTLGAREYGVFMSPTGALQPSPGVSPLTLVAEVSPLQYSNVPLMTTIITNAPPVNEFSVNMPLVDSSANSVPNDIVEAVRLLAYDSIVESNNIANRGVVGDNTTKYATTQGGSGTGVSAFFMRAQTILKGRSFSMPL